MKPPLFVSISILLLSVAYASEKSDLHVLVDVDEFVGKGQSSIQVTGILASTLFRTNVTRERFEDYIATEGADYVVTVFDEGLVRDLVELLAASELSQMNDAHVDLRYRLTLINGDDIYDVFYFGLFGEVQHNQLIYETERKHRWPERAWRQIKSNVLR